MRGVLRLLRARRLQLWAPELWRRFTITLRRVLARRLGMGAGELGRRCRLSFIKVAEFQQRAIVHFHALIRLDGPGDSIAPPAPPVDAAKLASAVREAAGAARLTGSFRTATG